MSEHRRLFFLLNIGQRRVQRWVDRKAETDARASAAQAGVLFFLAKQDGALIGEVGAALQLAPSAMTGLADRMARPACSRATPIRTMGAQRVCSSPTKVMRRSSARECCCAN